MRLIFSKAILGTALALGPVQAMYDAQEEDKATLPQTKAPQQSTSREKTSTSTSFKEDTSFESLPDNLFASIYSFLDIRDLGQIARVSTRWKRVTDDSVLWRYMGSRQYGDYLNEENLREDPKQKVISHYLSVIVNAKADLKEIERLVSHYRLDLYVLPFKKYIDLSFLFHNLTWISSYKVLIAQGHQDAVWDRLCYHELLGREVADWAVAAFDSLVKKGNQKAIKKKIEDLEGDGYRKDLAAAKRLNEIFVNKGDPEAIGRKIYGLSQGGGVNPFYVEVNYWWNRDDRFNYQRDARVRSCGYEKNPAAAVELNELLVKKGDAEAIGRKIRGLDYGFYGYEKNPAAARELNELLIEKGDSEAIERKLEGLAKGGYGYEKDILAAREYNEFLIKKGDSNAIDKKMNALAGKLPANSHYCKYYKYDELAAREFNELLVEKGDSEAIERKWEGLAKGGYGYEKAPIAAIELNELLIKKGDLKAINRKIRGLSVRAYGYEKDDTAAIELNELFIKKGDLKAIWRKIEGLGGNHGYGYQKDPIAAREFIETLVISNAPSVRAIGKYIKAFAQKYGVLKLGYEKDAENAIEFIKKNHVPY